jgi:Fe/S biogenesis protein NfuA
MITVTDTAKEKILAVMQDNDKSDHALRIAILGRGPGGFQYSMRFVDLKDVEEDDIKQSFDGLDVFIDAHSKDKMEGSTIDFVKDEFSEGFVIENPNPLWDDPLSQTVQDVLDKQINPAIASHGGFVSLLEVKDNTAYVAFGGGCVGCGMVSVTLKQGVETTLIESVPEITAVVDTTDHASGTNPYYQPSKGGESPVA